MATVIESQAVDDWVETGKDDDDDDDAEPPLPPPPLPPRAPVGGREPSPPLVPPPEPLSPTGTSSTAVRSQAPPAPRNLKQRYRVADLDLKSTLGN